MGVGLIAAERQEQIVKHGFSVDQDQYYAKGELIQAVMYSLSPTEYIFPVNWNPVYADKIAAKDRIGQLKVAGAMIAAEIDRLLLLED